MTETRERILHATRELLTWRGFPSTTVDAVLDRAAISKGAFFHHFPTKVDLGRAVVERYAEEDAEFLDRRMEEAEAVSSDPAVQVVALLRGLEEMSGGVLSEQPACLLVSFIYERDLADTHTDEIVRGAILHWRERIAAKLEAGAEMRPGFPPVDLPSLADQVFTVIEGALLLARALDDPERMRAQLAHLRHYLELLYGLPVEE